MDKIEIEYKGKLLSIDDIGSDLVLFMVSQDKNGGASVRLNLIGKGIEQILPSESLCFDETISVSVFEDADSSYERDLCRFYFLENYLKDKGLI